MRPSSTTPAGPPNNLGRDMTEAGKPHMGVASAIASPRASCLTRSLGGLQNDATYVRTLTQRVLYSLIALVAPSAMVRIAAHRARKVLIGEAHCLALAAGPTTIPRHLAEEASLLPANGGQTSLMVLRASSGREVHKGTIVVLTGWMRKPVAGSAALKTPYIAGRAARKFRTHEPISSMKAHSNMSAEGTTWHKARTIGSNPMTHNEPLQGHPCRMPDLMGKLKMGEEPYRTYAILPVYSSSTILTIHPGAPAADKARRSHR